MLNAMRWMISLHCAGFISNHSATAIAKSNTEDESMRQRKDVL
jgi:hypothetical protein